MRPALLRRGGGAGRPLVRLNVVVAAGGPVTPVPRSAVGGTPFAISGGPAPFGRRAVGLGLAIAMAAAGCGSPNPSSGSPKPGGPSPSVAASITPVGPVGTSVGGATLGPTPSPLSAEDAAAAYGPAPSQDPRVTYQPDVVFIGGGPSAIRWASEDGLTWAIDAAAPGAANLSVGSVMFATSVAVGRVAAIGDQGGVRVVTIAPIALTDLVRDADLQLDAPVDFGSAMYRQPAPGLPVDEPITAGASPAPGPSDPAASPSPSAAGAVPGLEGPSRSIAVELPAIRLASSRHIVGPASGAGPAADINLGHGFSAPLKICPQVGVGSWSVKACTQGQGLALNVDYKGSGLKFGAVLTLLARQLHVQAGTIVKDGQMVNSGGLLQGLDSFSVKFAGGVEDGAQDNVKFRFEVPIDVELGTQWVDGIPLTETFEFKLSIETAFSGKNSTMAGAGTYKIDGPVGYVDGKVVAPTVTTEKSLLDSLSGITIGASGVVLAVKFKIQGGIGLPAFLVGPYSSLTISVGVGRGSVLGAALAECKGATLGMWFGVGAGFNVSPKKLGWLSQNPVFQKLSSIKFEAEALQYEVFNRKVVTPDVPLCRG